MRKEAARKKDKEVQEKKDKFTGATWQYRSTKAEQPYLRTNDEMRNRKKYNSTITSNSLCFN